MVLSFAVHRFLLQLTHTPAAVSLTALRFARNRDFEIQTRGHSIIGDQPLENGGFDEGVTPPELLLASLASCAGYYAAQYLRKHNLAAEGPRVRVTCDKVKASVPRLTDTQQKGVHEAVEHCLVP